MWAGFIALVNQQLVANGQTHHRLHQPHHLRSERRRRSYTTDFHDITSGTSGSYSAVTGYDLVTGWGSPNCGPHRCPRRRRFLTALLHFTISASPTACPSSGRWQRSSTISTVGLRRIQLGHRLQRLRRAHRRNRRLQPNLHRGAGLRLLDVDYRSLHGGSGHLQHHHNRNRRRCHPYRECDPDRHFLQSQRTSPFPPRRPRLRLPAVRIRNLTMTTTVAGGFNSALTLSASGREAVKPSPSVPTPSPRLNRLVDNDRKGRKCTPPPETTPSPSRQPVEARRKRPPSPST